MTSHTHNFRTTLPTKQQLLRMYLAYKEEVYLLIITKQDLSLGLLPLLSPF
jgi:hypothetical protein